MICNFLSEIKNGKNIAMDKRGVKLAGNINRARIILANKNDTLLIKFHIITKIKIYNYLYA